MLKNVLIQRSSNFAYSLSSMPCKCTTRGFLMKMITNVFQRINKTKIKCNQTKPQTTQKNPPKQLNKSIREMERCIRNSSGIIFECFSTLVPIVLHEMQLPALNLIICHSSIQKLVQLLFFTAKSLMLM